MKIPLTNWGERRHGERTVNKTVTLYQNHITVIEAFAKRERRTFSNALQVIVEQWFDANTGDLTGDKEQAATQPESI